MGLPIFALTGSGAIYGLLERYQTRLYVNKFKTHIGASRAQTQVFTPAALLASFDPGDWEIDAFGKHIRAVRTSESWWGLGVVEVVRELRHSVDVCFDGRNSG